MIEYTFEMLTNFGMFRDHRHRILTLKDNYFLLNMDMIPKEISDLEF
jgi:hypothetical protein